MSRRRTWFFVALGGLVVLAGAGVLVARSLPGPAPKAIWEQAELDLKAENIAAAERAVERLAWLRKPTDDDWVLRAQVALARKRDEEALADLAKVSDASVHGAKARLLAGQIESRRDRMRFAEQYLLEAVRLDPKLVSARRELVYIYGMQSRRRSLGEQMAALAELEQLTFQHIYLWCLTRGTVWEPKEIVTFMTRYLKADPEDVWSRLALADALENTAQLDAAEEALKPLPDNNPDARAARVRLAIDRGDMGTAERLLAEGPEDHPILARYRGKLALRRRDAQAAIRHFRASEAIEPTNRDTIFGLSQALRLAGDPEAAKYAKFAHDLDAITPLMQYAASSEGKKDPTLPLKLGAALETVGRLLEAQAWFQFAVNLDPLDQNAQRALHRVRMELAKKNRANPHA